MGAIKSDVKKDGALATGRSDYDAAKFDISNQGGGFLEEKNVKASTGGEVAKKDGAIATGRSDYDAAEYEVKDGGDFLAEKNAKASEGGEVAKKEGPIEARGDE